MYLLGALLKIYDEHPNDFYRKAHPNSPYCPMKLVRDRLAHSSLGQAAVCYLAFNIQIFPSFRELIPRSSSGSLCSSPESDWLDVAMVNYGGTFLESEVNELRAMRKVVVFSFLLIPYWMIYSQVNTVVGTL